MFSTQTTMALNTNWKATIRGYEGSLVLSNAYCQIGRIEGTKNECRYTVNICKINKDNLDVIDHRMYSFIPCMDGANFIKQAYLHLKTLPEFADAIDC